MRNYKVSNFIIWLFIVLAFSMFKVQAYVLEFAIEQKRDAAVNIMQKQEVKGEIVTKGIDEKLSNVSIRVVVKNDKVVSSSFGGKIEEAKLDDEGNIELLKGRNNRYKLLVTLGSDLTENWVIRELTER